MSNLNLSERPDGHCQGGVVIPFQRKQLSKPLIPASALSHLERWSRHATPRCEETIDNVVKPQCFGSS